MVGGFAKVRRIRRAALAVDHPRLTSALESLRDAGATPRVPIRVSRKLHGPLVLGPIHTMVILPEKLLDQLTTEQLRCVLAHELTHVRQWDPLIGLLQRFVEAGYWPHPLVHVLNRDLVRAREEVCDNAALHGTTPPQYADTLLTVALGIKPRQATTPGAIGLMTRPWRLEERVKGLLDPHRRLTTTMNTRHLALIAISLATGTTLIAGARIVAAPNPPAPQDVVELHASYSSKTQSVAVTQESHRHVSVKVADRSKHKQAVSLMRVTKGVTRIAKVQGAVDPAVRYSVVSPVEVRSWSTVPSGTKVKVVAEPGNSLADVVVVDSVSRMGQIHYRPEIQGTRIIPLDWKAETAKRPVIVTWKSDDGKAAKSVTVVQSADGKTFSTADSSYEPRISDGRTIDVQTKTVDTGASSTTTITSNDSKSSTTVDSFEVRLDPTTQGSKADAAPAHGDDRKADPKSDPFSDRVKLDYGEADGVSKRQLGNRIPFTLYLNRKDASPQLFKIQNLHLTQKGVTISPEKHKPTTVYIKGGDIKIVGDDIKVVYLKPENVKPKVSPKPKGAKPKSNR
jgi:hypothetical protein